MIAQTESAAVIGIMSGILMLSVSGSGLHTLCLNKRHRFIFLRYICPISSECAIFWQKHTPGNLKQAHTKRPIYISFYMFLLYLVKTSDASERTLRRRLPPVCLVSEPESRNFFKSLSEPLTF